MPRKLLRGAWQLILVVSMGCGGSAPPLTAVEGDVPECVGTVAAPPPGLDRIEDPELLKDAVGEEGAGKLCEGEVFLVSSSVTVYRVWNSEAGYTLYGRWWSFELPRGPREAYREANDICEEWSPLDVMSSCTLKVGARIVMGPGQSVQCENGRYPKSAVNQVYIPNDSRNDVLFVEDCTPGAPWP
jgi:hypothetical protein